MYIFSPLTVGEGKDGAVQVAIERSEHPPLVEVDKMDLAVHAAGHGSAEVGHESNARHRVGVHRYGVAPPYVDRLVSVVGAFMRPACTCRGGGENKTIHYERKMRDSYFDRDRAKNKFWDPIWAAAAS